MSSQSLLPASSLGAVYHPTKKVLHLYAAGNLPTDLHSNFEYNREADDPTFHGPRYSLQGWLGHITQTTPYEYAHHFEAPTLRPGDSVSIAIQGHQNGYDLGITWSDTMTAKEAAKPVGTA